MVNYYLLGSEKSGLVKNVKSVNVSHLNIGVYLLEIKSGDKSYSQKVQITR